MSGERSPSTGTAGFTGRPAGGADTLLGALVTAIDRAGGELGVSLNVGGCVVSGLLVPEADYVRGIATDFRAAGAEELADAFETLGGDEGLEGDQDDSAPTEERPVYLHLREARVFAPGETPLPTDRGVWWRGRLHRVDGWFFGYLGEREEPPETLRGEG